MLRFLKFNVVGALGVVVHLGVVSVLVEWVRMAYLPATMMAVATAVVHNFAWHCRWTWADRPVRGLRRRVLALARFAAANGAISMVSNLIVVTVLVERTGCHPTVANAVAIAASGLLNYVVANTVVFVRRPASR